MAAPRTRRPQRGGAGSRARRQTGGDAGRRRMLPSSRKGFILTVVDGQNLGKEYFFESRASIGRVETNDIILVDPGISRTHAEIYDDQGIYLLQDAGSANGTRLNGERITETEVLKDGDFITISQTTLQFSQLDAARGDVTAQTSLSEEEARAVDTTGTRDNVVSAGALIRLLGTRRGKLIALALGLLFVGLLLFVVQRSGTPLIQRDASTEALTYSEEDQFFNAVFGYGHYDQSHLYQVVVNFDHLGDRATLQYSAWGVDKVGEVAIELNGETVGQVPLTMNRWVYGLKLALPIRLLRQGKTNQIVFKNTRNPPNKDTWEICYIQILQEALPPPDPAEASRQFDLAKKAWEDRDIEPINMYSALQGFKRARNLLEMLSERPELYRDAEQYIDKVDRALTRKFSEGLFSARRAEKLDQDVAKARSVLLETRRYFHKDDFRYREIQRYLDTLAQP